MLSPPQNENEEFLFYFNLAKPFVLNLTEAEERVKAAAWLKKLQGHEASQLRNDYLKLLLFILQRRRLCGPFNEMPELEMPMADLEEFPDNSEFPQMIAKVMAMEQAILRQTMEMGGGGEHPPYTTCCDENLKQYAAMQQIPDIGIQSYFAVSRDPLTTWDNFEKAILPPGVQTTENKIFELNLDDLTHDVSCYIEPTTPPLISEVTILEEAGVKKSPEKTPSPVVAKPKSPVAAPPPEGSPEPQEQSPPGIKQTPSILRKVSAYEKPSTKAKKRSIAFRSPTSIKEVILISPRRKPTWGSNLIEAEEEVPVWKKKIKRRRWRRRMGYSDSDTESEEESDEASVAEPIEERVEEAEEERGVEEDEISEDEVPVAPKSPPKGVSIEDFKSFAEDLELMQAGLPVTTPTRSITPRKPMEVEEEQPEEDIFESAPDFSDIPYLEDEDLEPSPKKQAQVAHPMFTTPMKVKMNLERMAMVTDELFEEPPPDLEDLEIDDKEIDVFEEDIPDYSDMPTLEDIQEAETSKLFKDLTQAISESFLDELQPEFEEEVDEVADEYEPRDVELAILVDEAPDFSDIAIAEEIVKQPTKQEIFLKYIDDLEAKYFKDDVSPILGQSKVPSPGKEARTTPRSPKQSLSSSTPHTVSRGMYPPLSETQRYSFDEALPDFTDLPVLEEEEEEFYDGTKDILDELLPTTMLYDDEIASREYALQRHKVRVKLAFDETEKSEGIMEDVPPEFEDINYEDEEDFVPDMSEMKSVTADEDTAFSYYYSDDRIEESPTTKRIKHLEAQLFKDVPLEMKTIVSPPVLRPGPAKKFGPKTTSKLPWEKSPEPVVVYQPEVTEREPSEDIADEVKINVEFEEKTEIAKDGSPVKTVEMKLTVQDEDKIVEKTSLKVEKGPGKLEIETATKQTKKKPEKKFDPRERSREVKALKLPAFYKKRKGQEPVKVESKEDKKKEAAAAKKEAAAAKKGKEDVKDAKGAKKFDPRDRSRIVKARKLPAFYKKGKGEQAAKKAPEPTPTPSITSVETPVPKAPSPRPRSPILELMEELENALLSPVQDTRRAVPKVKSPPRAVEAPPVPVSASSSVSTKSELTAKGKVIKRETKTVTGPTGKIKLKSSVVSRSKLGGKKPVGKKGAPKKEEEIVPPKPPSPPKVAKPVRPVKSPILSWHPSEQPRTKIKKVKSIYEFDAESEAGDQLNVLIDYQIEHGEDLTPAKPIETGPGPQAPWVTPPRLRTLRKLQLTDVKPSKYPMSPETEKQRKFIAAHKSLISLGTTLPKRMIHKPADPRYATHFVKGGKMRTSYDRGETGYRGKEEEERRKFKKPTIVYKEEDEEEDQEWPEQVWQYRRWKKGAEVISPLPMYGPEMESSEELEDFEETDFPDQLGRRASPIRVPSPRMRTPERLPATQQREAIRRISPPQVSPRRTSPQQIVVQEKTKTDDVDQSLFESYSILFGEQIFGEKAMDFSDVAVDEAVTPTGSEESISVDEERDDTEYDDLLPKDVYMDDDEFVKFNVAEFLSATVIADMYGPDFSVKKDKKQIKRSFDESPPKLEDIEYDEEQDFVPDLSNLSVLSAETEAEFRYSFNEERTVEGPDGIEKETFEEKVFDDSFPDFGGLLQEDEDIEALERDIPISPPVLRPSPKKEFGPRKRSKLPWEESPKSVVVYEPKGDEDVSVDEKTEDVKINVEFVEKTEIRKDGTPVKTVEMKLKIQDKDKIIEKKAKKVESKVKLPAFYKKRKLEAEKKGEKDDKAKDKKAIKKQEKDEKEMKKGAKEEKKFDPRDRSRIMKARKLPAFYKKGKEQDVKDDKAKKGKGQKGAKLTSLTSVETPAPKAPSPRHRSPMLELVDELEKALLSPLGQRPDVPKFSPPKVVAAKPVQVAESTTIVTKSELTAKGKLIKKDTKTVTGPSGKTKSKSSVISRSKLGGKQPVDRKGLPKKGVAKKETVPLKPPSPPKVEEPSTPPRSPILAWYPSTQRKMPPTQPTIEPIKGFDPEIEAAEQLNVLIDYRIEQGETLSTPKQFKIRPQVPWVTPPHLRTSEMPPVDADDGIAFLQSPAAASPKPKHRLFKRIEKRFDLGPSEFPMSPEAAQLRRRVAMDKSLISLGRPFRKRKIKKPSDPRYATHFVKGGRPKKSYDRYQTEEEKRQLKEANERRKFKKPTIVYQEEDEEEDQGWPEQVWQYRRWKKGAEVISPLPVYGPEMEPREEGEEEDEGDEEPQRAIDRVKRKLSYDDDEEVDLEFVKTPHKKHTALSMKSPTRGYRTVTSDVEISEGMEQRDVHMVVEPPENWAWQTPPSLKTARHPRPDIKSPQVPHAPRKPPRRISPPRIDSGKKTKADELSQSLLESYSMIFEGEQTGEKPMDFSDMAIADEDLTPTASEESQVADVEDKDELDDDLLPTDVYMDDDEFVKFNVAEFLSATVVADMYGPDFSVKKDKKPIRRSFDESPPKLEDIDYDEEEDFVPDLSNLSVLSAETEAEFRYSFNEERTVEGPDGIEKETFEEKVFDEPFPDFGGLLQEDEDIEALERGIPISPPVLRPSPKKEFGPRKRSKLPWEESPKSVVVYEPKGDEDVSVDEKTEDVKINVEFVEKTEIRKDGTPVKTVEMKLKIQDKDKIIEKKAKKVESKVKLPAFYKKRKLEAEKKGEKDDKAKDKKAIKKQEKDEKEMKKGAKEEKKFDPRDRSRIMKARKLPAFYKKGKEQDVKDDKAKKGKGQKGAKPTSITSVETPAPKAPSPRHRSPMLELIDELEKALMSPLGQRPDVPKFSPPKVVAAKPVQVAESTTIVTKSELTAKGKLIKKDTKTVTGPSGKTKSKSSVISRSKLGGKQPVDRKGLPKKGVAKKETVPLKPPSPPKVEEPSTPPRSPILAWYPSTQRKMPPTQPTIEPIKGFDPEIEAAEQLNVLIDYKIAQGEDLVPPKQFKIRPQVPWVTPPHLRTSEMPPVDADDGIAFLQSPAAATPKAKHQLFKRIEKRFELGPSEFPMSPEAAQLRRRVAMDKSLISLGRPLRKRKIKKPSDPRYATHFVKGGRPKKSYDRYQTEEEKRQLKEANERRKFKKPTIVYQEEDEEEDQGWPEQVWQYRRWKKGAEVISPLPVYGPEMEPREEGEDEDEGDEGPGRAIDRVKRKLSFDEDEEVNMEFVKTPSKKHFQLSRQSPTRGHRTVTADVVVEPPENWGWGTPPSLKTTRHPRPEIRSPRLPFEPVPAGAVTRWPTTADEDLLEQPFEFDSGDGLLEVTPPRGRGSEEYDYSPRVRSGPPGMVRTPLQAGPRPTRPRSGPARVLFSARDQFPFLPPEVGESLDEMESILMGTPPSSEESLEESFESSGYNFHAELDDEDLEEMVFGTEQTDFTAIEFAEDEDYAGVLQEDEDIDALETDRRVSPLVLKKGPKKEFGPREAPKPNWDELIKSVVVYQAKKGAETPSDEKLEDVHINVEFAEKTEIRKDGTPIKTVEMKLKIEDKDKIVEKKGKKVKSKVRLPAFYKKRKTETQEDKDDIKAKKKEDEEKKKGAKEAKKPDPRDRSRIMKARKLPAFYKKGKEQDIKDDKDAKKAKGKKGAKVETPVQKTPSPRHRSPMLDLIEDLEIAMLSPVGQRREVPRISPPKVVPREEVPPTVAEPAKAGIKGKKLKKSVSSRIEITSKKRAPKKGKVPTKPPSPPKEPSTPPGSPILSWYPSTQRKMLPTLETVEPIEGFDPEAEAAERLKVLIDYKIEHGEMLTPTKKGKVRQQVPWKTPPHLRTDKAPSVDADDGMEFMQSPVGPALSKVKLKLFARREKQPALEPSEYPMSPEAEEQRRRIAADKSLISLGRTLPKRTMKKPADPRYATHFVKGGKPKKSYDRGETEYERQKRIEDKQRRKFHPPTPVYEEEGEDEDQGWPEQVWHYKRWKSGPDVISPLPVYGPEMESRDEEEGEEESPYKALPVRRKLSFDEDEEVNMELVKTPRKKHFAFSRKSPTRGHRTVTADVVVEPPENWAWGTPPSLKTTRHPRPELRSPRLPYEPAPAGAITRWPTAADEDLLEQPFEFDSGDGLLEVTPPKGRGSEEYDYSPRVRSGPPGMVRTPRQAGPRPTRPHSGPARVLFSARDQFPFLPPEVGESLDEMENILMGTPPSSEESLEESLESSGYDFHAELDDEDLEEMVFGTEQTDFTAMEFAEDEDYAGVLQEDEDIDALEKDQRISPLVLKKGPKKEFGPREKPKPNWDELIKSVVVYQAKKGAETPSDEKLEDVHINVEFAEKTEIRKDGTPIKTVEMKLKIEDKDKIVEKKGKKVKSKVRLPAFYKKRKTETQEDKDDIKAKKKEDEEKKKGAKEAKKPDPRDRSRIMKARKLPAFYKKGKEQDIKDDKDAKKAKGKKGAKVETPVQKIPSPRHRSPMLDLIEDLEIAMLSPVGQRREVPRISPPKVVPPTVEEPAKAGIKGKKLKKSVSSRIEITSKKRAPKKGKVPTKPPSPKEPSTPPGSPILSWYPSTQRKMLPTLETVEPIEGFDPEAEAAERLKVLIDYKIEHGEMLTPTKKGKVRQQVPWATPPHLRTDKAPSVDADDGMEFMRSPAGPALSKVKLKLFARREKQPALEPSEYPMSPEAEEQRRRIAADKSLISLGLTLPKRTMKKPADPRYATHFVKGGKPKKPYDRGETEYERQKRIEDKRRRKFHPPTPVYEEEGEDEDQGWPEQVWHYKRWKSGPDVISPLPVYGPEMESRDEEEGEEEPPYKALPVHRKLSFDEDEEVNMEVVKTPHKKHFALSRKSPTRGHRTVTADVVVEPPENWAWGTPPSLKTTRHPRPELRSPRLPHEPAPAGAITRWPTAADEDLLEQPFEFDSGDGLLEVTPPRGRGSEEYDYSPRVRSGPPGMVRTPLQAGPRPTRPHSGPARVLFSARDQFPFLPPAVGESLDEMESILMGTPPSSEESLEESLESSGYNFHAELDDEDLEEMVFGTDQTDFTAMEFAEDVDEDEDESAYEDAVEDVEEDVVEEEAIEMESTPRRYRTRAEMTTPAVLYEGDESPPTPRFVREQGMVRTPPRLQPHVLFGRTPPSSRSKPVDEDRMLLEATRYEDTRRPSYQEEVEREPQAYVTTPKRRALRRPRRLSSMIDEVLDSRSEVLEHRFDDLVSSFRRDAMLNTSTGVDVESPPKWEDDEEEDE